MSRDITARARLLDAVAICEQNGTMHIHVKVADLKEMLAQTSPEKVQRNVVIYGAETGGWPCQICGFGHVVNTSCGVPQSGAGGWQSPLMLTGKVGSSISPKQGIHVDGEPSSPSEQAAATTIRVELYDPLKELGAISKMLAESGDCITSLKVDAVVRHLSTELPKYTNRHGEPCSKACGEGRHSECTETGQTCNCTYRGLHKTMHRYATIPAAAFEPSAELDFYEWIRQDAPKVPLLANISNYRAISLAWAAQVAKGQSATIKSLNSEVEEFRKDCIRLNAEAAGLQEQLEQANARADSARENLLERRKHDDAQREERNQLAERAEAAEAQLATAREALQTAHDDLEDISVLPLGSSQIKILAGLAINEIEAALTPAKGNR